MKATLRMAFATEGKGIRFATLQIDDLAFTPTRDIEFEHPVWCGEPRKPERISYNMEQNSFSLFMGTLELSPTEFEQHLEMYRDSDWDVK